MYSRATRPSFDDIVVKHTPPTVGPGTYTNPINALNTARGGYPAAPFGSQTIRKHPAELTASQWPGPDPQRYSVVDYGSKFAPGGASLRNSEARGCLTATRPSVAPDPGAYYVQRDFVQSPQKAKSPTKAERIKVARRSNPAPIPARWENLGYVEDPKTGSLVKAPVLDASKNGVAPNAYVIPDTIRPSSQYSGVNFARRSTRREVAIAKPKPGPPPGAYTAEAQKSKPLLTAMGTAADPVRSSIKIAPIGPAPNTYDTAKSDFGTKPTSASLPFGVTSARLIQTHEERERNSVPAPGQYGEVKTGLGTADPTTVSPVIADRRPFGQSSTRFPRPSHVTTTPGPAYNVESWHAGASGISASLRASSAYLPQGGGGFGSSQMRQELFRTTKVVPPPTSYDPKVEVPGTRRSNQSSVFRSQTKQLSKPANLDTPPPSRYNVRTAPSYSITHGANRKPFSSSERRFSITSTALAGKLPEGNTPDPGRYDPKLSKRVAGGALPANSRFENLRFQTPAPNSYLYSNSYAHSVLKPSFNATFDSTKTTV